MMPIKTSDGRIFINDVSEGLRELKLSGDFSAKTIYDNEGNNIKNIESILADTDDLLWLGTGNGLIEFDIDTKKTKRYAAEDGLQGSEFTRFAGYKASNGEMYFGGTNGFSVFHPAKIEMSNFQPPIVFTDFKLYQESVAIGENTPLKKNILLMENLILDYNENDFSFSFAALDFSNPHNIKYKYKLENHDLEWIDAGNNNTASYTNMDPGVYVFKVLATNRDGIWNSEAKSLKITITPPWWQTTLAYIIYFLLFITIIILVDRVQRKRLKEKERALARERELTQAKEIEKAYNELKITQKQLVQSEKMASLGELTAGIAHEI
ncbi:MAG: triple tyrosine motif-containing protein, partial [Ignavibacteria bacterium]|nr:triple tyrosine motif-containing protein [Ignavibacteria bacterium]